MSKHYQTTIETQFYFLAHIFTTELFMVVFVILFDVSTRERPLSDGVKREVMNTRGKTYDQVSLSVPVNFKGSLDISLSGPCSISLPFVGLISYLPTLFLSGFFLSLS